MSASSLAQSPEDCDRMLLAACERGDIDGAVALYEPGALLFLFPSCLGAPSHQDVRAEFARIIALKPHFEIFEHVARHFDDGNLASVRLRGEMNTTGTDGTPLRQAFHTLGMVRRQADGSWRFARDREQIAATA